jgi:hypothetical protein
MHQIDQTISAARPVPLTDQVRFDKDPIYDALDQMRSELDQDVRAGAIFSQELLVAIDTFDDVIHNARPVPLTDEVRVKREELDATARTLREAIARGNRPSPTN